MKYSIVTAGNKGCWLPKITPSWRRFLKDLKISRNLRFLRFKLCVVSTVHFVLWCWEHLGSYGYSWWKEGRNYERISFHPLLMWNSYVTPSEIVFQSMELKNIFHIKFTPCLATCQPQCEWLQTIPPSLRIIHMSDEELGWPGNYCQGIFAQSPKFQGNLQKH